MMSCLQIVDSKSDTPSDSALRTTVLVLESESSDRAVAPFIYASSLVDQNLAFFKNRSSALLDRVGDRVVSKGIYLREVLTDKTRRDFWQFSLFCEKPNLAGDSIWTDYINAILIEKLVEENDFESVAYFGKSDLLKQFLKALSFEKNLSINLDSSVQVEKKINLTCDKLFFFAWLTKKWLWSIIFLPKPPLGKEQKNFDICFIGYSDGVKQKTNGDLFNTYWGELPNILTANKCKICFLDWFSPNSIFSSKKGFANYYSFFDESSRLNLLIDSKISFKLVVSAIKDYFFLSDAAANCLQEFSVESSRFDCFHLEFFKGSFFGSRARSICMQINLMEEVIGELNSVKKIVWLYENQAWERVLYSFPFGRPVELYAYAHSSIRRWDLRYFFCAPLAQNQFGNEVTAVLLCNGSLSYKIALESNLNIQFDRVEVVEATRYALDKYTVLERSYPRRIIIHGDHSSVYVKQMFAVIGDAARALRDMGFLILFNPHPNCPVDYLPSFFDGQLTNWEQQIFRSDVHVVGSVSTIALELLALGFNPLCFFGAGVINPSPLAGVRGVDFFVTGLQLSVLLDKHVELSNSANSSKSFFCCDPKFSRWRKILVK